MYIKSERVPHHPNLQSATWSHEKDNVIIPCNGVELILVVKLKEMALNIAQQSAFAVYCASEQQIRLIKILSLILIVIW